MTTRSRRAMPLAAAAASLTFGACGGDDGGPPSDSDLARQAAALADDGCEYFQECGPDQFAEEFDDLQDCIDYYIAAYNQDYFRELAEGADDPDACREALSDAFSCYASSYTNITCDSEETCGTEGDRAEALCPGW